jgi:hypothetical protein
MEDKQVPFAPFHAVNQFMVEEYRHGVIQLVFRQFDSLPANLRATINGSMKKLVSIPGFRNSAQAPLLLRIKNAVSAFERSPEFASKIMSGWSALKPDLRKKVYDLLIARGWDILPLEADRSVLPGFITVWKEGETYEALNKAFIEMFPDSTDSEDDVRLMIVWVGNRLPFNMGEEAQ